MKKILLAVLTTFILSAANAAEVKDPNQCPSVSAVVSVGVNQITRDSSGILVYQSSSSYDTNSDWFFGLGLLSSKMTDKEALDKANSSLSNLNFLFGPFYSDIGGWFCVYADSNDGYVAFARTLPFASISEFRNFMNKK